MKIIFTLHAKEKLLTPEIKNLTINHNKIINILKNPGVVDKTVDPHQSIGHLTDELSLSVIWKVEKGRIKVVTFYPAGKGRYENKILQRR